MNETEKLFKNIAFELMDRNILKKYSIRSVASYFNVSHTIIAKQIKMDRISLKVFKAIKQDEILKDTIYISNEYIVNNILCGV